MQAQPPKSPHAREIPVAMPTFDGNQTAPSSRESAPAVSRPVFGIFVVEQENLNALLLSKRKHVIIPVGNLKG
jgi:hypothetical protein